MRLHLPLIALASLLCAGCASLEAPAAAPLLAAPITPPNGRVADVAPREPLKLREPIMGVMVGIIDFSSWGVFRVSTLKREPTDSEWLAAGLASLNLIGASTLITVPGTGDHDAEWTRQDAWRAYAEDMQHASMAVSFAVRDRNASELSIAADRLANACQACHAKYRPELPQIMMARLASPAVQR